MIPNEVLRPLHQLIRLPIDMNDKQKITPDHYAPLTPEIKLFLAKNELVSLPPELWTLANITVLSLRNNELTELPPSISRLRNLQELNIAGNQLRWLPWEMLDLMLPSNRKLVHLNLSPNPFIKPLDGPLPSMTVRSRVPNTARECAKNIKRLRSRFRLAIQSDTSYESLLLRLHEARLFQAARNAIDAGSPIDALADIPDKDPRPIYVTSSKTIFFDFDGSILRSPMSSFTQSEPTYTASLGPVSAPSHVSSAAPSLFELSARVCARSPFIGQLSSLLPDEASPPVVRALSKAIESKPTGLPNCSVCRKQYVIPRAEWMEFWYDGNGSGEQFLPFVRKACGWKCVKDLAETRRHDLNASRNAVDRFEASLEDAEVDDAEAW